MASQQVSTESSRPSHAPASVTPSYVDAHILYEPCVKPSGFKGRKAYSSGNLMDKDNGTADSEARINELDGAIQLLPPVIVVDAHGGIHSDVSGQSNEEVHSEDDDVAIEGEVPTPTAEDLGDIADGIRISESQDASLLTWQPQESSDADAANLQSRAQQPLKRARATGRLPQATLCGNTQRRVGMPQIDWVSGGLSDRTVRLHHKGRPMRVVVRLPSDVLYDILLLELLILLLGALAFYLCQGGSFGYSVQL